MTDEPMVERLAEPLTPEELVRALKCAEHGMDALWDYVTNPGENARLAERITLVARIKPTIDSLTTRLAAAEDRADESEADLNRLHDAYESRKQLQESAQRKLIAAEHTVREQREALEGVKHYALRHVGTDSRAILALVVAALAPDTEGTSDG